MPIKFRCEHCQQLLGISRSRAAATVDCPQCGRSLRVPGSVENATTETAKSEPPTNSDTDLLSALNELTMLGHADDDSEANASDASSLNRPFDDSAVVIQGQDVPSEQRSHAVETAVSSSGAVRRIQSSDGPSVNSEEALQDLASWADSEAVPGSRSAHPQIATDLLTEMRQASHPSSWLASLIAAALLILISGAGGWWLAKSESLEQWLGQGRNQDQGLGIGDDRQQVAAEAFLPAAIRLDPTAWVVTVTGQVQYADESGQSLPDGRASVYLLPSERQGNLKVHARSFERESSNADRRFSEAALQALGGLRVEADDDGKFSIGSRVKADEYQLIVVSRHRSRAENMLPDSNITNTLMPWFDSTVHVLGKRDAVIRRLTGSEQDLRIEVGK